MTNLISHHEYVLIAAALAVLMAAHRDLREFRIPNECSILLLVLYPLHVWLSPGHIYVVSGAVVATVVFAAGYLVHAIGRFGGGDVKLIASLSLWSGPALISDFLIVTALAGGVMAIVYMSRFRLALAYSFERIGDERVRDNILAEQLPYGLAIAAGGFAVLIQLAG